MPAKPDRRAVATGMYMLTVIDESPETAPIKSGISIPDARIVSSITVVGRSVRPG
jgi:hypothetical protein